LFLTNEATLETNSFPVFPLPHNIAVLTPQCELKIAEKVRVWHHEELVTPVYHDTSNPYAYFVVFGIPFVKVFITLIDQFDFFW
jgi:hypothetical protein